jgi:hypothetical protein
MFHAVQASALQGLHMNQRAFERHADAISRCGDPAGPGLLPEDVVGLLVSERGYEANLAVLARTDDMLGTLIDIRA